MNPYFETGANKLHRTLSRHAANVAIRNSAERPDLVPKSLKFVHFLERHVTVAKPSEDILMEVLGEKTRFILPPNNSGDEIIQH